MMAVSQRERLRVAAMLVGLSGLQQQVLEDRTEGDGGEEGQGSDDDDGSDEEDGEERGADGEGALGWGDELLSCEVTGEGEHGDDHEEASDEHGDGEREVPPGGVGAEAGEGGAVVAGGGGEGVEDFREAVRDLRC